MSFSDGKIRLIVRADDMGILHSCNMAVLKAFEEGILTCAGIITSAPWAREAAEMAKANPSWCIGTHLCVIGEWRGYPWRPVLSREKIPSIVDEEGFFYRSPRDFFKAEPDYGEVKSELKAQIELLMKWGVRLCYLDTHYIGFELTGEEEAFIKVVKELSEEYGLPVSGHEGEKNVPGVFSEPPWVKEYILAKQLEELTPSLWLLVEHLLVDSPNGRALVHTEPAHVMRGGVSSHRVADLECLLSPRIKEVILHKGIKLVDYCNFRGACNTIE